MTVADCIAGCLKDPNPNGLQLWKGRPKEPPNEPLMTMDDLNLTPSQPPSPVNAPSSDKDVRAIAIICL